MTRTTLSGPSSTTRWRAAAESHEVTRWAREVVAGRLPVKVGRWVRLACERHLRDLDEGPSRGLWFDVKSVNRAIAFFRSLRHTKGSQFAGKPIELAPYQRFAVGNLVGWKRVDGTRRFRVAYWETAKKSGKTTIAAGLALLFTFFDTPLEYGAEGYAAATKRDQAKAVWDEAAAMVRSSPGLAKYVKIWGGTGPKTKGALSSVDITHRLKFEPLGKDTLGLDGVNVHFAVVDELHKHPDRTIWDILNDSTGARRQPMVIAITNAGFDQATICGAQRIRAEQVLEGSIEADDFFAFVCGIDKGDDWKDESNWAKANPGLGTTVSLEKYRAAAKRALSEPGYVSTFRRYYCGEWVAVDERAIDMVRWNACSEPVSLIRLRRRRAYGGLDLASTIDLAAFTLALPPAEGDELWPILTRVYVPEQTLVERERVEMQPYAEWARLGLIQVTPGATIDYSFIRVDIQRLCRIFDVVEIGFDPYQANETRTALEVEGHTMVLVRQGHQTLAAPTRSMERMYMEGKLRHGGNPVLRWMASNVVWRRDANNNYIPDKGKAAQYRRHIDGISSLVTALSRAVGAPPPPPPPGVMLIRY